MIEQGAQLVNEAPLAPEPLPAAAPAAAAKQEAGPGMEMEDDAAGSTQPSVPADTPEPAVSMVDSRLEGHPASRFLLTRIL